MRDNRESERENEGKKTKRWENRNNDRQQRGVIENGR